MTPPHLVVVGASLAGLRAVEAARKAGHDGPITLVGEEIHLPYDRPPLSKEHLHAADEQPHPPFRGREHFDELGIGLRLGVRANGLDLSSHMLCTTQGDIGYDKLVIATGARARQPACAVPGGAPVLRTVDDAATIKRMLPLARRVVVVGAGFIGAEVASAARKHGAHVTIVEAAHYPLERALGRETSMQIAALHAANGVSLRTGTVVAAVTGTPGDLVVHLDDGSTLDAQLVVFGIGAVPNADWLEGSGLDLQDGIACDPYLRAAPDIYAAGDVARWTHPLFGRTLRLENWTSAAEQGALAARNALGVAQAPCDSVPYVWSDWYGHRIQCVGITSPDHVNVPTGDDAIITLFVEDERVVGAVTVDRPTLVMKIRRLISDRAGTSDALALIDSLERARHAPAAATAGGSS
jgi:NADPH-dependent 2,4-dienoyl-CoA reductase/sulfur reductase-like enzyme